MPDPQAPIDGHVWLIDYAGHPFTADLAAELARRGQRLTYSYCSSNATPHADFEKLVTDGIDVHSVDLGRSFAKHNPAKRTIDELDYGIRTSWQILRNGHRSDQIIACQVPVLSALVILLATRLRRQHFTLWLQDIQSNLASLSAGSLVTSALARLERLLIRRSPRVIAISEQFAEFARSTGNCGSVAVLPNWAPLDQIVPGPRVNKWSRLHGISEHTFRVVYSGTMGSKHRGRDVAELACHLLADERLEIVVVASGEGAEHLATSDDLTQHERFHLLPLQPLASLSNVLATADCLLVTLDHSATEACVPSKVLSYLCAARPIVCLMNDANPSTALVSEAALAWLPNRRRLPLSRFSYCCPAARATALDRGVGTTPSPLSKSGVWPTVSLRRSTSDERWLTSRADLNSIPLQ